MLRELVVQGSIVIFIANLVCFFLGYVRDILIVKFFGSSAATDAWYVASSIPELLFKFLLFGALGASLMPVFMDYLTQHREKEAWEIVSSVINTCVLVLAIVAIAGVFFASRLVYVLAPGFDPATHALATTLAQVVIPLIVLMVVAGILLPVYTAYYKYIVPALASVVTSVVVVVCIAFFAERIGIFSIAWGTVAGYSASFVVLIWSLCLQRKPYTFKINLKHPAIRSILLLMIPLIGAEIIGKGIGVVDRIFASFLPRGAITAFSLADRIITIPITFFSTTMALAVFPVLSRCASEANREQFFEVFIYSLKMSLFCIVPSVFGILVIGRPLIRILFEHGKFSGSDVASTAQVLVCLSIGLAAMGLRPLLSRACYALKKNWVLLRYELYAFVLNALLDYILIQRFGLAGIAMATTIVAILMTAYLLNFFSRELGPVNTPGIRRFLGKVLVSSGAMALGCWSIFGLSGGYATIDYRLGLLKLIIAVASSVCIYMFTLKALGLEELDGIWQTLRKAILKKQ